MFIFLNILFSGGKFDPIILYSIYEYIQELWQMTQNSESSVEKISINVERYNIFLPIDLESAKNEVDFSSSVTKWIPHYLYIYRCSSSSLLLFVKIKDTFTEEGLKDLETYIDVQLPLLTNDIHDYLITNHSKHYNSGCCNSLISLNNTDNATSTSFAPTTAANSILTNFHLPITTNPKYLFVNKQTLKHFGNLTESLNCTAGTAQQNMGSTSGGSGSILSVSKHRQSTTFPNNIMNLLIDLIHNEEENKSDSCVENTLSTTEQKSNQKAEDTIKAIIPKPSVYGGGYSLIAPPEYEETLLKSTEDFWIVKRQCNWRQFYVIIFSKKSTLLNVMEEAERIFEHEITDDVFFDK